ncbi:MAG: hypothetical protein ACK5S2_10010 [Lysobacteraceae bacterium]|jgi:integrase|nr:hypothetical protein [Silanimonas sp.]
MAAKRIRNGVYEYVFRHRLLGDQPVVRRFHRAEDGDRFASEMERALKRGFVPAALLEDQEPLRSRRLPVETLRALMISYRYNCSIKPEDHYLLTLLEERLPKDLGIDQIDYDWAESFVRSLKLDYNLAPGTIRKYVGALARCLDWGMNKKRVLENPLRRLPRGYTTYHPEDVRAGAIPKIDQERDRRLSPDEEARIRRLLEGEVPVGRQRAVGVVDNAEMKLIFDLALETAMRMREMYTVSAEQVDLKRRTIFLSKTALLKSEWVIRRGG